MYLLVLRQQKNYTAAWDKIKAKSYQIPHDSHALQHAKTQKIILSGVSSTLGFCSFHSLLLYTVNRPLKNMNPLTPAGEVQGGL